MHVQNTVYHIMGFSMNRMHGSAAVQFSDVKVNRVTKHIEVKFFITGAEFHDQIRSIAPL